MPNNITYTAIPSDMPEHEADQKLDDIKKHMENPSSKTILLATAPWCGHCKALKPVLKELQTKIKDMKGNGLITHIDDTHHDKLKDFTKVEINGFPSIRFRRRNDGYSGNNSYPYWNNFFSAPSWYDYWWSQPCECKRGCTPDGCAYPGNGIDDCVWATDCNCCNF